MSFLLSSPLYFGRFCRLTKHLFSTCSHDGDKISRTAFRIGAWPLFQTFGNVVADEPEGAGDAEPKQQPHAHPAHIAPQNSNAAKTDDATNTPTDRQARGRSPWRSAVSSRNPPENAPVSANTNASGYMTSSRTEYQPPPIKKTSATAPIAKPSATPTTAPTAGTLRRERRCRTACPCEVMPPPLSRSPQPPHPSDNRPGLVESPGRCSVRWHR